MNSNQFGKIKRGYLCSVISKRQKKLKIFKNIVKLFDLCVVYVYNYSISRLKRTKMKRIDITLDDKTLQKAKTNADRLKLSLSAYIRLLINSK